MRHSCDFLVIGSGLAGLLFALKAAAHGTVTLLTKDALGESNSRYAQGGVAAVWDEADSFEDHIRDTMIAGAGLCRREAVEHVVRNGPRRIQELIALGVSFSRSEDEPDTYELGREGGHGRRRILHAKDQTGAEIVRALVEAVNTNPRITVTPYAMAIDLITTGGLARRQGELPPHPCRVLGAYVLDLKAQRVDVYQARIVALCTGGAGKVYTYTTNPDIATGDGMAMAWRAGARMANMEFVQFHPTCLFHSDVKSFLISEALRGEGARLLNTSGERFMSRYDTRLELAPRDIVARAIDAELKRLGADCVYLDISHQPRAYLSGRFPAIYQQCAAVGIDIATQPIPVVPAAHYFCGGVAVDLTGESSLRNLFAIGETSCTGLHGANRLASNSLLEAAVFAHSAAEAAAERLAAERPELVTLSEWDAGDAVEPDELVVVQHTWSEVRRFMWNYVGIVRTTRRLKRARRRVHLVQEEIRNYYWDFRVTGPLIELRNLATVAGLVVDSALRRRESRGLHYTLDFPESDRRWIRDTELERRF
ncbi:MAG: L-aspartate oxidase [Alphaproteobacteria bacterium]|nr:L-aspartate oxidase [Alphaproteobacteria bacterium]